MNNNISSLNIIKDIKVNFDETHSVYNAESFKNIEKNIEKNNKMEKKMNRAQIISLVNRVKNYVLNHIKSVLIIGSVLITALIVISFTVTTTPKKFDFKTSPTIQKAESIKAFRRYKKITSQELISLWVNQFHDSRYKRGGNPNFKEFDCISSVTTFLWNLGAKTKINTVVTNKKILENISDMYVKSVRMGKTDNGYGVKRERYKDIKTGDIIITHGVSHMGIVAYTAQNYIVYVDVNNKYRTMGIQSLSYNDKKVNGVYEMSLYFWLGEYLDMDIPEEGALK